MDVELNLYISRSEEISDQRCVNDTKWDQYDGELEMMILFLEHTINIVRSNRDKFRSAHGKPCADSALIKYNEETNQYNCNIDGIKLRGNLGNIYDRKILQNDRIKAHQVVPCKWGNTCKNVLTQTYCKFYHDPEDLLILKNAKIISEEYYADTIKLIRNFSSTSWLYSSRPNEYMRSFGSFSTLNHDIEMMELRHSKEAEISNLKAQVMHDILLLRVINAKKE